MQRPKAEITTRLQDGEITDHRHVETNSGTRGYLNLLRCEGVQDARDCRR